MLVPAFPTPAQQPKNALLTSEAHAATLAHECHQQVVALTLLAGASRENRDVGNDLWYHLLCPISEQLERLAVLLKDDIKTGELVLRRYPS